jgi:hypothetical protein
MTIGITGPRRLVPWRGAVMVLIIAAIVLAICLILLGLTGEALVPKPSFKCLQVVLADEFLRHVLSPLSFASGLSLPGFFGGLPLFPPPTLRERRHRRLARLGIAYVSLPEQSI